MKEMSVEEEFELTAEECEGICNLLHNFMQFYDENGQPANGQMISRIEAVLRDHFGHDAPEGFE